MNNESKCVEAAESEKVIARLYQANQNLTNIEVTLNEFVTRLMGPIPQCDSAAKCPSVPSEHILGRLHETIDEASHHINNIRESLTQLNKF